MKKKNALLVFALCILLIIGLWGGINLWKDQPLFSNPRAKASLKHRLKKSTSSVIDHAGDTVEKAGKKLNKILE
ncbi:MAG: hypothetical protein KJ950_16955 [Proteobacteria bacterium]|nr:hypothetical protein [Pseudomonadota bacterium]MBU1688172.1 hypothetical protein [Pseudomonadota bacterium]